jgi:hypothetical protein
MAEGAGIGILTEWNDRRRFSIYGAGGATDKVFVMLMPDIATWKSVAG